MIPQTAVDVISGKTIRFRGFVQEGKHPKDLTNDQITFAVYEHDTQTIRVSKSTQSFDVDVHPDGQVGVYVFQINPGDWGGLTRNEYLFEIELVDSETGDEVPLELGTFSITHSPL